MKSTISELLKRLDYKIIIFLGIMLYYIIYWGNFKNFTASIDHDNSIFPDFVEFYYPAGKAILHSLPLPDSFYYSTFAAILFVPFAFFSLPLATILWGSIQIIFIALLFIVYLQKLPKNPTIGYILTFIFFTNAALLNNLKWGQVSVLIFCGIFIAFLLYEQNKHTLSAVILGITIAVKFFPAVFLIYFFFKKDWKYLALCIFATITCLLIVPAAIVGWHETLQSQFAISGHASTMIRVLAMDNIDSQYFASVITRIMRMPTSSPFTGILVDTGYLAVLIAVCLVYVVSKTGIKNSPYWAWGILSATIPFWIPSAWPHYFVFLPFLQVLIFDNIQRVNARWKMPAIMLWMFSVILSNIFIAQIVQNWFRFVGVGSLFWSNLFILILTAFIVLSHANQVNQATIPETNHLHHRIHHERHEDKQQVHARPAVHLPGDLVAFHLPHAPRAPDHPQTQHEGGDQVDRPG